jgi:hypothetical protein
MMTGAWAISPSCGLGNRATLCRTSGSPQIWPGTRAVFPSGQRPASGVGGQSSGCRVDGPLNLPRDQLWIVPCRGCPKQQVAGQG